MADRSILMVDANYVVASLAGHYTKTVGKNVTIDASLLPRAIYDIVKNDADQLSITHPRRQYWYDGIPDAGITSRQHRIASVDGVILRGGFTREWSGRVVQKAVDTLLVADMVKMAIRNEVDRIYLVTGDLDMVPGVNVAVEAGVIVTVMTVGSDATQNASSALIRSCDRRIIVEPEGLEDCVIFADRPSFDPGCGDIIGCDDIEGKVAEPDDIEPIQIVEAVTVSEPDADPREDIPKPVPRPSPGALARSKASDEIRFIDVNSVPDPVYQTYTGYESEYHRPKGIGKGTPPYEAAEKFAQEWLDRNPNPRDIDLITDQVNIPHGIDSELLRWTSKRLDVTDLDERQRVFMREGFRDRVLDICNAGIRS